MHITPLGPRSVHAAGDDAFATRECWNFVATLRRTRLDAAAVHRVAVSGINELVAARVDEDKVGTLLVIGCNRSLVAKTDAVHLQ